MGSSGVEASMVCVDAEGDILRVSGVPQIFCSLYFFSCAFEAKGGLQCGTHLCSPFGGHP